MKNSTYETTARKSATLSRCEKYRYLLTRDIEEPMGRSVVTFIMLNPSTADGLEDDATIRKCVKFTNVMGGRLLQVVNLFAWRATEPIRLLDADDPIGPDNDRHILAALNDSDLIILAWGSFGGGGGRLGRLVSRRQMEVTDLMQDPARRIVGAPHALRLSKSGQPWHPLYLRDSCRPFPVQKVELNGEVSWELAPW